MLLTAHSSIPPCLALFLLHSYCPRHRNTFRRCATLSTSLWIRSPSGPVHLLSLSASITGAAFISARSLFHNSNNNLLTNYWNHHLNFMIKIGKAILFSVVKVLLKYFLLAKFPYQCVTIYQRVK